MDSLDPKATELVSATVNSLRLERGFSNLGMFKSEEADRTSEIRG